MLKNNKELIDYLKDHTVKETAYEFKVSQTALYYLINSQGLPYKHCPDVFDGVATKVLKEYCKDKTLSEIAEHYNTTVSCAKRALNKRGVFFKKSYTKNPTLETRSLMIKMLVKTFTYQQIADQFGITRQRVEQIVNNKDR